MFRFYSEKRIITGFCSVNVSGRSSRVVSFLCNPTRQLRFNFRAIPFYTRPAKMLINYYCYCWRMKFSSGLKIMNICLLILICWKNLHKFYFFCKSNKSRRRNTNKISFSHPKHFLVSSCAFLITYRDNYFISCCLLLCRFMMLVLNAISRLLLSYVYSEAIITNFTASSCKSLQKYKYYTS